MRLVCKQISKYSNFINGFRVKRKNLVRTKFEFWIDAEGGMVKCMHPENELFKFGCVNSEKLDFFQDVEIRIQ